MGKELTSGRLPCYPSSMWKLIPSSVSKPRDPLAGGITWVSAVGASPPCCLLSEPLTSSAPEPLRDNYCFKSVLPTSIFSLLLHQLHLCLPDPVFRASCLPVPGLYWYRSGRWRSELCNSISCCRRRADLQKHAREKTLINTGAFIKPCLTPVRLFDTCRLIFCVEES